MPKKKLSSNKGKKILKTLTQTSTAQVEEKSKNPSEIENKELNKNSNNSNISDNPAIKIAKIKEIINEQTKTISLGKIEKIISGTINLPLSPKGLTALHYAIMKMPSMVPACIKAGADINQTTEDGITPLHCAVITENLYLIKSLLRDENLSAIINMDKSAQGITPFQIACEIACQYSEMLQKNPYQKNEELKNKRNNMYLIIKEFLVLYDKFLAKEQPDKLNIDHDTAQKIVIASEDVKLAKFFINKNKIDLQETLLLAGALKKINLICFLLSHENLVLPSPYTREIVALLYGQLPLANSLLYLVSHKEELDSYLNEINLDEIITRQLQSVDEKVIKKLDMDDFKNKLMKKIKKDFIANKTTEDFRHKLFETHNNFLEKVTLDDFKHKLLEMIKTGIVLNDYGRQANQYIYLYSFQILTDMALNYVAKKEERLGLIKDLLMEAAINSQVLYMEQLLSNYIEFITIPLLVDLYSIAKNQNDFIIKPWIIHFAETNKKRLGKNHRILHSTRVIKEFVDQEQNMTKGPVIVSEAKTAMEEIAQPVNDESANEEHLSEEELEEDKIVYDEDYFQKEHKKWQKEKSNMELYNEIKKLSANRRGMWEKESVNESAKITWLNGTISYDKNRDKAPALGYEFKTMTTLPEQNELNNYVDHFIWCQNKNSDNGTLYFIKANKNSNVPLITAEECLPKDPTSFAKSSCLIDCKNKQFIPFQDVKDNLHFSLEDIQKKEVEVNLSVRSVESEKNSHNLYIYCPPETLDVMCQTLTEQQLKDFISYVNYPNLGKAAHKGLRTFSNTNGLSEKEGTLTSQGPALEKSSTIAVLDGEIILNGQLRPGAMSLSSDSSSEQKATLIIITPGKHYLTQSKIQETLRSRLDYKVSPPPSENIVVTKLLGKSPQKNASLAANSHTFDNNTKTSGAKESNASLAKNHNSFHNRNNNHKFIANKVSAENTDNLNFQRKK